MIAPSIPSAPRKAHENDIPAITKLWQETGLYRPYNPPEWDVSFALSDSNSTFLVWEDTSTGSSKDTSAGPSTDTSIIATIMVGHDGHRGWLYYLAVAPAHQKTGLGKRLVAIGEDWLRERGVWRMQLMVRSENSAMQDFYRHLGYRALDVTVMQKDIDTPPAERLE